MITPIKANFGVLKNAVIYVYTFSPRENFPNSDFDREHLYALEIINLLSDELFGCISLLSLDLILQTIRNIN